MLSSLESLREIKLKAIQIQPYLIELLFSLDINICLGISCGGFETERLTGHTFLILTNNFQTNGAYL